MNHVYLKGSLSSSNLGVTGVVVSNTDRVVGEIGHSLPISKGVLMSSFFSVLSE